MQLSYNNLTFTKLAPYSFPTANESLLRGLPKKQLSVQQEDELAGRIQAEKQQEGTDLTSINELAIYNMREAFAYTMACSRGHGFDPGTIFSMCWKALCYAATNFQPGRIRFLAFAKPYLRSELYKTHDELKVVRHAECQTLSPDVILQNECADDHNEAACQTRDSDTYLEAKADIVESGMEGIMSRDEWNAMVPILQSRLSEKERMVLELKYQSGFNFRQIGDLLRVSRSDTQATHTRAINKVRGALKGKRALFSR